MSDNIKKYLESAGLNPVEVCIDDKCIAVEFSSEDEAKVAADKMLPIESPIVGLRTEGCTMFADLEEARDNPYRTEHAASQHDPANYSRFSRKTIAPARPGRGKVDAVLGWKGGKSEIQSLRFPIGEWTVPKIKKWLKEHGFKARIERAQPRNNPMSMDVEQMMDDLAVMLCHEYKQSGDVEQARRAAIDHVKTYADVDEFMHEFMEGICLEMTRHEHIADVYGVVIKNLIRHPDFYSRIKTFDRKELEMGTKEEMEHTDNPIEAERIAIDHLYEDGAYYSKLKKAMKRDNPSEDICEGSGEIVRVFAPRPWVGALAGQEP